MTSLGILFFVFIIVSYVAGVWVGMRIKKPKIIIKNNNKDSQQYKDWKNKVSSIGPR